MLVLSLFEKNETEIVSRSRYGVYIDTTIVTFELQQCCIILVYSGGDDISDRMIVCRAKQHGSIGCLYRCDSLMSETSRK